MKKLVSLTLALVLIVACLSGISFAADPIAKVTTDGKTVEVTTVEELQAAISAKGTSSVTLLKDITHTATADLPVCTLDMNGHSWTGKDAAGEWVNAIYFNDNKTDADATNLKSVLKNGTVHGKIAVSCNVGSLHMQNVTACAYNGTAVQLTDSTTDTSLAKGKWNDSNIVEGCTLYSANYTGMIYNSSTKDFSAVKFLVKDTTMVTQGKSGVLLSCQTKVAASGSFELGKDVEFYYLEGGVARTADPAPVVTGEKAEKVEGTYSVTVAGTTYEGFNKSATPVTPAPVAPVTPAAPATPSTPAAPSVPTTGTPDVEVPKTGVSVIALGVMAVVSLAGAVVSKKH